MKSTERILGLIGCALLGLCFVLRRSKPSQKAAPLPVEVLAEDLKRAWAGYHTP